MLESTAPGEDGRISFGPLEPGEYDLTLFAGSGERWTSVPAWTRRVTLGAGRNALTLPMPRLFMLSVADPEGRPETLTFVMEGQGNDLPVRVDEAGRAAFGPLPEGRYQLRRGDGMMRITLPGPSDVVFHPQPYNALRMTVADPDGLWARAGFADGDLIVAIDGKELESADDIRAAIAAAPAKVVTFAVLRGGRRIEVQASAKDVVRGDMGGSLDWTTR
jgi:hypothetical protein